VVRNTRTFERANIHADVAMLTGTTFYGWIGDWPGWLGLALTLWLLSRTRPGSQYQP
jgi:apolipoprotein N-acyltransferase